MYEKFITKDQFDSLKKDVRLLNALRLARIINAVRASRNMILRCINDRREKLEAVQYYGAVLYESMKTFDGMKGQFDQLDVYRTHADDINCLCDQLREPASFTKTILASIRDKVVFHFDMDVFTKAISDIDLPTDELVIAEADSANGLDTNYPAPTMLCLNYLILSTPYHFPTKLRSDEEKLRFILDSMDSLSDKVCKVIESIIPALLEGHVHVRAV